MLNAQRYKEEIIIAGYNFAFNLYKDKIEPRSLRCDDCLFDCSSACIDHRIKWLLIDESEDVLIQYQEKEGRLNDYNC